MHLCEAAMYLSLWGVLYRHNVRMASAIGHQEARKRLRKSAVSLVCEMYFYGIETVTSIIFALVTIHESATTYNLVLLAWQFSFPVRNTVQAMSTDQTRHVFAETIYKILHISN